MRCRVIFAAATLLVTASQPGAAQINVDMNQMTCGGWLGYASGKNAISSASG